jgi:hypothetical protein
MEIFVATVVVTLLIIENLTRSETQSLVFNRDVTVKGFIEKRIKPPEFNKNSKIFG